MFVMEHGLDNRPVPLTELFEPDWLARFSLGRLYEHGEFGGQEPGGGLSEPPCSRATDWRCEHGCRCLDSCEWSR